jgi:hypothetical protein
VLRRETNYTQLVFYTFNRKESTMDIILKSLASAVVTAIILVIAKFSGPKLAGAIGGIPIVFAISYILLTMGDRGLSRQFLVGGIYGAIAAIFFSLILIWLNAQFLKTHWINFTIAYFACFLLALALVYFTTAKQ